MWCWIQGSTTYLQYTVYNLSFFLPVSKNVCHWRLTAYQSQRGSKTAGVHTTFAFIIPLLEVYILGNHFASTIVGPISVRPFSILSYWNTCDPDSATLCPKSSVDPLDLRNVHRQTCQAPKDWGSKAPCWTDNAKFGHPNRNVHPNKTELTRQIWDQKWTCTFSLSRNFSQDRTQTLLHIGIYLDIAGEWITDTVDGRNPAPPGMYKTL